MSAQPAPVGVNEILAKLSKRGRLEWDLACALAVNERLEARITELEQATVQPVPTAGPA